MVSPVFGPVTIRTAVEVSTLRVLSALATLSHTSPARRILSVSPWGQIRASAVSEITSQVSTPAPWAVATSSSRRRRRCRTATAGPAR